MSESAFLTPQDRAFELGLEKLMEDFGVDRYAPKLSEEELVALQDTYGTENYDRVRDLRFSRGKGVYLWDTKNRPYLDLNAMYSAKMAGYAHPRIIGAIVTQAMRLTGTQNRLMNDVQPQLLREIAELTGQDKVILMNSGAEAVDTAVKIARRWKNYASRKNTGVGKTPEDHAMIITAHNNFHGRTLNAVAMSSVAKYRDGFGPFAPGYVHIPFNDFDALRDAITSDTAAFIIEPIQGEGGINIPSESYLRDVRELCDKTGVLLIFDEIQSGLGRTGRLFAKDWFGVEPDGIILGKALGGYLPVSAFAAKREIMDLFTPGSHGSTFGGNPLACAAGLASLSLVKENDFALVKHAKVIGEYFLAGLRSIRSSLVRDIRGKGLFIGIDIDPAKKKADAIFCELLKKRMITGVASNNVIRLSPPLVISKRHVDTALERFEEVLSQ